MLKPAYLALCAALLFGASTPAAKFLTVQIEPQMLAGLLYLGSGLGLTIYQASNRMIRGVGEETPLKTSDLPWVVGVIVFGGVAAPIFLMYGLTTTAGGAASLLLNFEAVFTAILAWFVFRENVNGRVLLGLLAIVLGGVILSCHPGPNDSFPTGSLAIIAACFCWGLDNNFTRSLSASDPIQIAAIKGLTASIVNCSMAIAIGNKIPDFSLILLAAAIGFFGYGVSLCLYIIALRHLGAARSSAYFSTAPFTGAFLSVIFLHDSLTPNIVLAAFCMGLGIYLHLTEKHEHRHTHLSEEHEHLHTHDEHHQHEHPAVSVITEPHSHFHSHNELTHSHEHFPDIEHRHQH